MWTDNRRKGKGVRDHRGIKGRDKKKGRRKEKRDSHR